jgi:hypothetical protein
MCNGITKPLSSTIQDDFPNSGDIFGLLDMANGKTVV